MYMQLDDDCAMFVVLGQQGGPALKSRDARYDV